MAARLLTGALLACLMIQGPGCALLCSEAAAHPDTAAPVARHDTTLPPCHGAPDEPAPRSPEGGCSQGCPDCPPALSALAAAPSAVATVELRPAPGRLFDPAVPHRALLPPADSPARAGKTPPPKIFLLDSSFLI